MFLVQQSSAFRLCSQNTALSHWARKLGNYLRIQGKKYCKGQAPGQRKYEVDLKEGRAWD